MRNRILGLAFMTSMIAIAGTQQVHADPPIWESNFGTSLGLTDDSTFVTTFSAQDFRFAFEGVTYIGSSPLAISSNGFVSLGRSNGPLCCSPTSASLVAQSFPMIAPMWTDLVPSSGVYLNAFNDSAGPMNDRLVVTWLAIHFANGRPVNAQLQLKADGTILFGYNGYDLVGDGFDNVIVGVSRAAGSSDPGNTDLSAAMPFHSGAQGTIYQFFSAPDPPVDLDQTNVVFNPNGLRGFRVTRELCVPALWESNYGLRLSLTDDSTYETTFAAQSFTFPFGGSTYSGASVLSISSNGFISIGGTNGSDCCTGDPNRLLSDPFARIAALWQDIRPGTRGDVFLNTFHDSLGGETTRLVITWDSVFYQSEFPVAVQLQLRNDGSFTMGWQCFYGAGLLTDLLVGTSLGGGATDPGPSDFSAAIPFSTNTQSTVYEVFPQVSPDPASFDLAGTNLSFEPNGSGGYVVTSSRCQPPIWEPSFGTDLMLFDDSTFNTTFGAQNFTFPFAGSTYAAGTQLEISSNGFVSLGGSNDHGCCFPTVPDFLTNIARIAPLWVDLVPRGRVYLNAFNDWGGPGVDRLIVTWDAFFYQNGGEATVQLQLLSNGTIVMGYRCFGLENFGAKDGITGITPGGGAADPGSTNLTASIPYDSGSQSTIYQFFPGPTAIDLAGRNLVFEPNGSGGYHVGAIDSGAGTVNALSAVVATRDVLRVNGSTGSPVSRVVTVAQNAPISVTLGAALQGPASNAGYALWVWAGSNFHPTELSSGASRIGCFVNPTPLHIGGNPQPIECLVSHNLPSAICRGVHVLQGPASAPWTVNRAGGFSHRARFTLQGVLRDNGAANSLRYSATNAVVIDIP